MLAVFQILTIGAMIAATYLLYRALGARPASLLFTREEKRDWDAVVGGSLGEWLTSSNIFATLTSLATVYVFFIGNTYVFGGWVLVPIVTMIFGGYVTKRVTAEILRRPNYARLTHDDQASSVLLSLFWGNTAQEKSATTIIKWITLINISAVLWLDFTVFSDISSRLIGSSDLTIGASILFLCAVAVLHFTIKFGMRGFVFADLFQSPLIIIGSLVLLLGAFGVIARELSIRNGVADVGSVVLQVRSVLSTPAISLTSGILFSISCLFLNSFLVLVTPPHWLRMWAFGSKEMTLQVRSIIGTAAVWFILVLIGALASVYVSLAQPATASGGNDVVVDFLSALATKGSVLFAVAFWIAGMAALFASADVQIYSFWLVKSYHVRTGSLRHDARPAKNPILPALIGGLVFTALYIIVRHLNLPFDRLVLILLPSCLTIAPSLVLTMLGARQSPIWPAVAVALYVFLSGGAFLSEAHGEALSVAAPIAPLVLSIAALVFAKGGGYATEVES